MPTDLQGYYYLSCPPFFAARWMALAWTHRLRWMMLFGLNTRLRVLDACEKQDPALS